MGLYCLSKTLLSAAVLTVMSASVGLAESHCQTASGSIRAVATVVAPLGVTSPEDNRVTMSSKNSFGLRDISRQSQGVYALSLHRMLIRYPSVGSVMVSIEAEPGTLDSFPLTQLTTIGSCMAGSGPSHPGAVIVDLSQHFNCVTDPESECVITLIYTEN